MKRKSKSDAASGDGADVIRADSEDSLWRNTSKARSVYVMLPKVTPGNVDLTCLGSDRPRSSSCRKKSASANPQTASDPVINRSSCITTSHIRPLPDLPMHPNRYRVSSNDRKSVMK